MPLSDLPVPSIGEPGFDDAARKILKALAKALNWTVQKGSPLRLRDHPDGFELGLELSPIVRGAVLTSALASGTRASPTNATATLDVWNGTAWQSTGTTTVKVYCKFTLPATLAIGSAIDIYQSGGDWHVLAATPC